MSEDPGHKAMLYFLEVLMNSNGALTISQLAGRFGSRSFTSEMRQAAGGNESGLKKFFSQYPSLFTVSGNLVSLFDSSKVTEEPTGTPSGGMTPSGRSLPDVSAEMEAVQYFRNKLLKKEEEWVPLKSLAGHLSQASYEIRMCVGPQLEFRNWVLRHPHIFEVQDEMVGLRDGIAAVTGPSPIIPRDNFVNGVDSKVRILAPKTPPATRRLLPPKSPTAIRRSHSFSEQRALSQVYDSSPIVAPNTPGARRRNAPITMTANEYKAVMFLKDIIEKESAIKITTISGYFTHASEGVRNTIGWTKPDQESFLIRNANVFHLADDGSVTVNSNVKLNVIITGSRPPGTSVPRTLNNRKGRIYHVAKLWGIVDLGNHEHVFFDKSIMRLAIDDLQKDYKVGEMLCFNAVQAMKTSRAKWRATHVWKENELEPSEGVHNPMSPAGSIEEEINRFLPQYDRDDDAINNSFESSFGSNTSRQEVSFTNGHDSGSPSNYLQSSVNESSFQRVTINAKPKPDTLKVSPVPQPRRFQPDESQSKKIELVRKNSMKSYSPDMSLNKPSTQKKVPTATLR